MADHAPDPYAQPEPARERGVVRGVVVAVLAATVLVAGLLTVLTDDADDVDPVALLSGAPDAAHEAGTARVEMRTEITGGMSMEVSAEGLVDFSSGASAMTMQLLGMELEVRTVDGTVYLRLPDIARPAGFDASWIGMPATAGASAMTGTYDAGSLLDTLQGMGSDVEELGEEDVNGQDAHGYRITVDVARAMDEVPEADRARMEDALSQLQASAPPEIPMDVWVTDDGLPVRMVMTMEGMGGTPADLRMQIDYVDFGIDVDIEPPPADDTVLVDDPSQIEELFTGAEPEAA